MPPQLPPIGAEVPQVAGLPPIGGEVSAAPPMFRAENAKDAQGNALVDYASEATASLNPKNLYHALKSVVFDLPGVVKNIGQAQGALLGKAEEAYKAGRYTEASRHMVNYLLPLVGPRLDEAGDDFQQGNYAKGLGVVTDLGVQMALPKIGGKVTATIKPGMSAPVNPVEASAVRFGEARGVPLDAGTRTGSQFVKNVQKKVGGTWGGANTVETAQRAQAEALTRVGGELTEDANRINGVSGQAMSPVRAGEQVRGALQGTIQQTHQTATRSYDAIRAVEADPARAASMRVNVSAEQTALKPLYERLKREAELVPLQGGKARALTALDRFVNGPSDALLSELDSSLGDLKAMARGAEMPELRTGGQATAAQAVKVLDARVRSAAMKAGPDVLKALEEGRAATTQKYVVADALDLFGSEPRQVYNALTAGKDIGLEKLRAVQQHAPTELPNIARAFLEDMMDTATAEGGFARADKLQADWQRLGADSKRLLFPKPGQVQALDDFFLLAKKIGQNPNPSGTAQVLNATNLIAGIPAWGLAKLLYTPRGVTALTSAVKLSMSVSKPARATALAQLIRAADDAGIRLAPAAAENDQATGQTPTTGRTR